MRLVRSTTLLLALFGVAAVATTLVSGWYLLSSSKPTALRVAVGGQGSNIDKVMSEVAAMIASQSRSIRLELIYTDGSATSARLVADKTVELGAVQADIPTDPSVQLVASLAREQFQLIARRGSGIRTLRDLVGRSIGLPPEGTSGHQNFLAIAQHHDLPTDRIEIRAAPVARHIESLMRGEVDAVAFVRALRDPAVLDVMRRLEAEGDSLTFVPVPQASAIRLQKPYVTEAVISEGTYRGYPPIPEADVPTLGVSINLVAGAAVPAAAVEELTRVLFEEQLRLAFRTPLAADIERPTLEGPSLPLHAGARNYFEGTEPFFLYEHREAITFTISMATLVYSMLMMVRSRVGERRKIRVSAYNDELMKISDLALHSSDFNVLRRCRSDLDTLINKVMRDFSEERISDQGFHIFSLTWDAVRSSVNEALAEAKLGQSSEAPSYNRAAE